MNDRSCFATFENQQYSEAPLEGGQGGQLTPLGFWKISKRVKNWTFKLNTWHFDPPK